LLPFYFYLKSGEIPFPRLLTCDRVDGPRFLWPGYRDTKIGVSGPVVDFYRAANQPARFNRLPQLSDHSAIRFSLCYSLLVNVRGFYCPKDEEYDCPNKSGEYRYYAQTAHRDEPFPISTKPTLFLLRNHSNYLS